MNKKIWRWILIICVVAITVVFTVVLSKNSAAVNKQADDKELKVVNTQDVGQVEETLDIKTKYVTLRYPIKWKDNLKTVVSDEAVEFYAVFDGKEDTLLFALEFNESEGYLLGNVGDTNIYIVNAPMEFDDTWSEEEQLTCWNMQDDVNFILEKLAESDDFDYAA